MSTASILDQRPDRGSPDWFAAVRAEQKSSFDRMNAITATAAKAGRSPLASEARDFDRLETELRAITELADAHSIDYSQIIDTRSGPFVGSDSVEYRSGQPLTRSQTVEGYIRSRGLAGDGDGADRLSLRKALKGIVTGQWRDAEPERRAMAEGTGAAGGFLVPTLLSGQLIDLARNQTRVLQAGARVVPMENKTVDVAKWASDAGAAWHTENAVITPTDATIAKVTLSAQALASIVVISRELLEDADNVEDELRQAFAAQFALKVDLAALYGSGTPPEPRGVKNTAAVVKTPLGGANGSTPTNYDFIADAIGRLADANETATGVIYSPRTARGLGKLKDTTGQPLMVPAYVSAVPTFSTNQVPGNLTVGTSLDTSDAFVADWRQLIVGVRTELQISVLTERYSDFGQVGILAWWRGDVVVARPAAFDVTTGVRP